MESSRLLKGLFLGLIAVVMSGLAFIVRKDVFTKNPLNDYRRSDVNVSTKSWANTTIKPQAIAHQKPKLKIISFATPLKNAPIYRLFCNIPGKPCLYTNDLYNENVDAYLFHMRQLNYDVLNKLHRQQGRSKKVFIIYCLESEMYEPTLRLDRIDGIFNWTATYKRNSDIYVPYGRTIQLEREDSHATMNLHQVKTKMVLWMVNNCGAQNTRLEYAKELSKYITVDIFGKCTGRKCPGGWCSMIELGRQYKFFLAFENSICTDYITEKIFENALTNNMVPIVFGASRADYMRVAPPHSFIHVDDFKSASELAKYLKVLDDHPERYNEYFLWRRKFRVLPTELDLCLFCTALHDPKKMYRSKNYSKKEWTTFWNRGHCVRK